MSAIQELAASREARADPLPESGESLGGELGTGDLDRRNAEAAVAFASRGAWCSRESSSRRSASVRTPVLTHWRLTTFVFACARR